MKISLPEIDRLLIEAVDINAHAATVIASSQSRMPPFACFDDGTRIYCAVLAAQGRQLAERAIKQMGLKPADLENENRAEMAARFFEEAARHVDTDTASMEDGRLAALRVLLNTASDLVARADRVLKGEEDRNGRSLTVGGYLG